MHCHGGAIYGVCDYPLAKSEDIGEACGKGISGLYEFLWQPPERQGKESKQE